MKTLCFTVLETNQKNEIVQPPKDMDSAEAGMCFTNNHGYYHLVI